MTTIVVETMLNNIMYCIVYTCSATYTVQLVDTWCKVLLTILKTENKWGGNENEK